MIKFFIFTSVITWFASIQEFKNTPRAILHKSPRELSDDPVSIGATFLAMMKGLELDRKKEWKVCCIYKITSPVGKIYIGQTSNLYRRKIAHRNVPCPDQPLLHQSFLEYGRTSHIFEVLHICTKEELYKWEIHYINLYQSFNTSHGLNLQAGGKNGKASKQTKEKMSRVGKGKKYSPEGLKNIQEARKRTAKAIIQLDKEGNFIKEWKTAGEAARSMGIKNGGNITEAGCKKGQTIYGFKWKFKNK